MQVDVEDRLPRLTIRIEDGPVPTFVIPVILCDRRREPTHRPNQRVVLGRQIVQRGDVGVGDDQHVERRLRADVAKGDEGVVPVDDGGGDLTRDDLAEEPEP